MNQMFMGIILILGLATFYLYNQNQTLSANNLALEGAVEEQQAAMTAMKESFEKQGKSLQQMMQKNAQIEQEMNQYLDIFRRHNLNQLAVAKPGMIEKRVNNATKQVFESIENDSKELSNLNSANNPNYIVEHSSNLYIIDKNMIVKRIIPNGLPHSEITKTVRSLSSAN